MSKQTDTVNRIYVAFGKGDIPAILATSSPTVAWESWPDNFGQRAGVPWLAPRSGREGAADTATHIAAAGVWPKEPLRSR